MKIIPEVAYKFIKREYISDILGKGEIRINTLQEVRNIEKYGEEVGDKGEGTQTTDNINIEHTGGIHTGLELVRLGIASGAALNQPKSKIILKNCKAVQSHPNCYILCLSKRNSRHIGRQLGCDACIRITDLVAFIKEITQCINKQRDIVGMIHGSINYSTRIQQYGKETFNGHPAFLKEKKYDYQNEYRIIWITKEEDIKPFSLQCEGAIKYCELVKYPD